MKHQYTSLDQLPVSLSAPEVAQFLGISRAGAYNLLRTGAADGSFVLVRDKENTSQYKLAVTGRDIEQKVLTLEFDSDACLWDMMSCESGSLVAEDKSPDIVFAVCNYIKQKGNFEGSASELLAAMGDTTTPVNTLTKALNTHKELLLDHGVVYEYRRTNSKKIIELAYCP